MPAGEVFKEKSGELLRFIRRRVRTEEDAEDILQEVFYQFYRAINLLTPIENISAWLYKAARNKIIDLWRKKKDIPISDLLKIEYTDSAITDIINDPYAELLSTFYTPEDEYDKELFWASLEEALDKLPQNQREVFELTEFEGVTFKELSKQTGTPINTLLSRKHYAVISLRKSLVKEYAELFSDDKKLR
ncbi:MAG: sigma-70 family RNA polymerase sigma factor [Deferribacteraceae bacterium]|jgi:RNA polymerase sigma factor (sigma-70 family)|nr:sigma-70 family RNA polymerase sigma factor [Deferribacteraceae bacterium]